MNDPLGYMLGQARRGVPAPAVSVPSVVTRSDVTGVWVTPAGGDTTSPLGPCTGGLRPALIGNITDGYQIIWELLPVGTKCLVVNTSEGPFIVSF